MAIMWGILGFLVTISVLVTIHEWGHFIVARWCGVKVLRFSLGFGKPFYTWHGKKDNTKFTLAPIPLGGFVQMYGESDKDAIDDADRERSFMAKKAWQRFLITAAGPVMNLIFAVFAFSLLFVFGVNGLTPTIAFVTADASASELGIRAGDKVVSIDGKHALLSTDVHLALVSSVGKKVQITLERDGSERQIMLDLTTLVAGDEMKIGKIFGFYLVDEWLPAKIGKVIPASTAAKIGLQSGDEIVAIDGEDVDLIRISEKITALAGQNINLSIIRDNRRIELQGIVGERDLNGKIQGFLGVQWAAVDLRQFATVERYPLWLALQKGIGKTFYYVEMTYDMFAKLIIGKASLDNLGGPLTIGDIAGKTLQIGWDVFLNFMGVVSLSLAAINLLPIPTLDGGHMMLSAVEMLRGKPLSKRITTWIYRIGFTVVVSFMALVVLKDFYNYLL